MKITKRAVLTLSLSGFAPLALAEEVSQAFVPLTVKTSSAQDEAQGFIEDSSLTGSTRNWFAKEKGKRGLTWGINKGNGATERTGSRDTWVQGTIVNYTSGFTQGTVGFSTEVAAYNTVALEQGKGRVAGGGNRTLTDRDGEVVDQWTKAGLANLKARVSNTVVTAGRQSLNTPVLAFIGNRALPSSFEGVSVHSAEFDNLDFDLGTFSRVSPRTEQSLSKFRTEYGNGTTTDQVNIFGLNYQPLKSLTTSLYASNVKDVWNQYYFGAAHELGDASVLSLSTGFNYYKTKDAGSSKMGAIDNDTYSLSLTATHKAHSLTLAFQEVNGDEYFDYLHETNAIFLANSLFSDYNGPNEKSFQVGYGLDMASYGVPGLKFSVYTARGWGIDGTRYKGGGYDGIQAQDGESHYEYGFGTSYAVQGGPLKASTIRATYSAHRASANQVDGSLNELRIVTTIPFQIL